MRSNCSGMFYFLNFCMKCAFFFFFQAEDGIRYFHVTGVQTCALPISDRASHRAWLASQSALPAGFRVGVSRFEFTPAEVRKPARMTIALIALERPSADFAAVFTRNAFPGAPVIIGRARLDGPALAAVVVNN